MQIKISALESEKSEKSNNNFNFEEEMKDIIKSHEDIEKNLKIEIATMASDLENMENKLRDKENQLKLIKNENIDLNSKLSESNKQLNDSKQNYNNLTKDYEDIVDQYNSNQEYQNENTEEYIEEEYVEEVQETEIKKPPPPPSGNLPPPPPTKFPELPKTENRSIPSNLLDSIKNPNIELRKIKPEEININSVSDSGLLNVLANALLSRRTDMGETERQDDEENEEWL